MKEWASHPRGWLGLLVLGWNCPSPTLPTGQMECITPAELQPALGATGRREILMLSCIAVTPASK